MTSASGGTDVAIPTWCPPPSPKSIVRSSPLPSHSSAPVLLIFLHTVCHSLILHSLGVASLSRGCCHKVPQTQWLQTTGIYSLIVPEARGLKARCPLGHAPSGGSRGRSFFASLLRGFWRLPDILGLSWFVVASLESLPLSSHSRVPCVSVPRFPASCVDTSHWLYCPS